jgi:hypothetical protein
MYQALLDEIFASIVMLLMNDDDVYLDDVYVDDAKSLLLKDDR